jgi:hypothetical protein
MKSKKPLFKSYSLDSSSAKLNEKLKQNQIVETFVSIIHNKGSKAENGSKKKLKVSV